MDSTVYFPLRDLGKCYSCGCSCSSITSPSETWIRSVKRKHDEFEDGGRFFIPGFDVFSNPRVGIENECAALRETVTSQQLAIQDLYIELEEERNASSSAANEAMSMILRLQREKAEIQMESRQYKRFAEEKIAHDQQEILSLEDLLYKREQAIQAISCEIQAYKHRMMSYGLTEAEVEGEKNGLSRNPSMIESIDDQFDFPSYNYPPLKCNLNEISGPYEADNNAVDIEKYAFGETPNHLKNLEYRINLMEGSPSSSQLNVSEKVIIGQSPRRPRHFRKFSTDSSNSFLVKDGPDFFTDSPRYGGSSLKKMEYVSQPNDYSNLRKMDIASENEDEMSDRVYTIDSVHNGVSYNGASEPKARVGIYEDYLTTPRDFLNQPDVSDPEVKKLYMRLQALEADRESMRQAIISIRTDKAQLALLKEIAQQLCKEMPPRPMPVRKPSILGSFSLMSIFKWVVSFVFWRKKAHRSKYMFGLSVTNVGLRMLLDKGPRLGKWRCLSSTQIRDR